MRSGSLHQLATGMRSLRDRSGKREKAGVASKSDTRARVLAAFAARSEPTRVSDLMDELKLSHSGIKKHVDVLVCDGSLVRVSVWTYKCAKPSSR